MAMETQVSQRKDDEPEWGVRARMISRDNTISRRFSYSHVSSFREDHAFKSNFTISSTASSPGYSLKEEIDPSTYSFTNALKALQLRSINTWEYLSAEGFALNSKWNEAERYICNPFSGEVPMECLSSKTLLMNNNNNNNNGRSFRNKITMSAPLIHHSSRLFNTVTHQPSLNLANVHPIQDENEVKEKEKEMIKRDVGIQSSPSPTSTPSIKERSINSNLAASSQTSISSSNSNSNSNLNLNLNSKSECQVEDTEVVGAKEEETKKDEGDESKKPKTYVCMCKKGSGCLFLKNLWSRKNTKKRTKNPSLNDHFKECLN